MTIGVIPAKAPSLQSRKRSALRAWRLDALQYISIQLRISGVKME
jgi:hypothetical protein